MKKIKRIRYTYCSKIFKIESDTGTVIKEQGFLWFKKILVKFDKFKFNINGEITDTIWLDLRDAYTVLEYK